MMMTMTTKTASVKLRSFALNTAASLTALGQDASVRCDPATRVPGPTFVGSAG
jgi:hypothetical protein